MIGPESKRARTSLPAGRTDGQLVEVMPDKSMTSKQARLYCINKSKDLARGLMGLMKGQDKTLDAFAKAGKRCLSS